jgi:hypothetical protein
VTNNDERVLENYRRQTLAKLYEQYYGLQKGIPDMERRIGIINAQIQGLLDYQPEGFEAKVEELRGQLSTWGDSVKSGQRNQRLLRQVIDEKEAAL